MLTNTHVLTINDLEKDFVLCTNYFFIGMGRVLMNEGNSIYYELRNLKGNTLNYKTDDLEMASIMHVLKVWRHYIMGRKFNL